MVRRFFALSMLIACGGNVDLGGSPDATDAEVDEGGGLEDAGDARACGTWNPPNVASACVACAHSDPTCQPNGCFNGYYCDTAKRDCHPPPTECDAGDAGAAQSPHDAAIAAD